MVARAWQAAMASCATAHWALEEKLVLKVTGLTLNHSYVVGGRCTQAILKPVSGTFTFSPMCLGRSVEHVVVKLVMALQ